MSRRHFRCRTTRRCSTRPAPTEVVASAARSKLFSGILPHGACCSPNRCKIRWAVQTAASARAQWGSLRLTAIGLTRRPRGRCSPCRLGCGRASTPSRPSTKALSVCTIAAALYSKTLTPSEAGTWSGSSTWARVGTRIDASASPGAPPPQEVGRCPTPRGCSRRTTMASIACQRALALQLRTLCYHLSPTTSSTCTTGCWCVRPGSDPHVAACCPQIHPLGRFMERRCRGAASRPARSGHAGGLDRRRRHRASQWLRRAHIRRHVEPTYRAHDGVCAAGRYPSPLQRHAASRVHGGAGRGRKPRCGRQRNSEVAAATRCAEVARRARLDRYIQGPLQAHGWDRWRVAAGRFWRLGASRSLLERGGGAAAKLPARLVQQCRPPCRKPDLRTGQRCRPRERWVSRLVRHRLVQLP
mmetsp:Transcript_42360/g.95705  ORF Transcript_42360/g.95705 Transcript_42360/m.95705 type:complete len:414 (+) Transcript_42360:116-1357(+)